jgi:hypothetical protein
MESVRLQESRLPPFVLVLATVLAVPIPAAFAYVGIWLIHHHVAEHQELGKGTLSSGVVMLLVSAFLVVKFWYPVRYRAFLSVMYELTSQGVTFTRGSETSFIAWHDFNSAKYSPLFSILVLRSALLETPLVVFVPTEERAKDGTIGKGAFVKRLLETKMDARYRVAWFP